MSLANCEAARRFGPYVNTYPSCVTYFRLSIKSMNLPVIPKDALGYGLLIAPVGTHTSKTMMLIELSRLLAASPPETGYAELRCLVVEDNATLKATVVTRKDTFRRLAQLYALRPERVLYRALRDLWAASAEEQPVIALLCALARDPLLRATAPVVLNAVEGDVLTPQMLEAAIDTHFPGRYSPVVRARVGQNTISSWAQSGHLVGYRTKTRVRLHPGPAATTYALLLGYLCGDRGAALLDTFWARVLDSTPTALDGLAFMSHQRGWLDYRRIGNVAEIDFRFLLRSESNMVSAPK